MMIYLTFDTNIWIYSLDDAWSIENQLDYLEQYIEDGTVKLLLPEIIISEWNKHRDKQAEIRKEKLNNFFKMAEGILPSAFFSDYQDPIVQSTIINNQLSRIDTLINNSVKVPINDKVKEDVIEWGIAKYAPMHKKASVADAIIVLSLIDYAQKNVGNTFFFLSANSEDFCKKGNNEALIHDDLKIYFDKYNISYIKSIQYLIYNKLKSINDFSVTKINKLHHSKIKNRIKERIYNPEYEKLLPDKNDQYIQNVSTIDFILKFKEPTKEQVIFVLALIDSDVDYEKEFYGKLKNKVWFQILKKKGVFHSDNNPTIVSTKDGDRMPFWNCLMFLENLSVQIKSGDAYELIDDILDIIKNVSSNPIDNDCTWSVFITILSNIPNDKLPIEILEYIPLWFSSQYPSTLQTSKICQNLLPKFLVDNPSAQDISKAEIILKYLFIIEKNDFNENDKDNRQSGSYHSKIYLPFLNEQLISVGLISNIITNCSDNVIFNLADTLKKLLIDYPAGIKVFINDEGIEVSIKVYINDKKIKAHIIKNEDTAVFEIENYEDYNENELRTKIIEGLESKGIKYVITNDNDFNIERLIYVLNNDPDSALGLHGNKLGNDPYDGNNVREVFSWVFRNLLNEKVKQFPTQSLLVLNTFALNNTYKLPFFKRILLYIITDNWSSTNNFFFNLLKNDADKLFSDSAYKKALYLLLDKNQELLTDDEIDILYNIIEKGPQDFKDNYDLRKINYWKFRWYSALNKIEKFKDLYNKYSADFTSNKTDFRHEGELTFRKGSVSPLTIEEILGMDDQEIVNFIQTFNTDNTWESPSFEGLGDEIGKSVSKNPNKFSENIGLYNEIYYYYSYSIIYGFREAWVNNQQFDWQKVLIFCRDYVSSEKFISGKLALPNANRYDVSADLVIGAIGSLLSEGMRVNNRAFNIELLPLAKEIIILLMQQLKPDSKIPKAEIDYLSYSFNSTPGKVLRATLDYSLMKKNNDNKYINDTKWENDVKTLFENSFKLDIIDGYILEGMYFQQFYFLDKDWIINEVKSHSGLKGEKWRAFITGITYGSPPISKELYDILYEHYDRVIINEIELNSIYNDGIINHLVAFYFWEYEDLDSNSLIRKFIDKSKPDFIKKLVNFVSRQSDYPKTLLLTEQQVFENRIVQLWLYIINRHNNNLNEESKILASFSSFIKFISELNKSNVELILMSVKVIDQHIFIHEFIEELFRLKLKGNANETADYIGQILNELPFRSYIGDDEMNLIIDLIGFLYENNQVIIANLFCNRLRKLGHQFLNETYHKYNL